MFTGIISAVGQVTKISAEDTDPRSQRELVIETPFSDVQLGESIAVNGACLTAARIENGRLTFFASRETCDRTNLGGLRSGSRVNLERAMRLSDRVSGHLVQGHVDGQAELLAIRPAGDSFELEVTLPADALRYVIRKGSITLDGISLTVNSIKDSAISLMIIPHTWTHTTLNQRQAGDLFNIELDMVAKHLERLMQAHE